MLKFVGELELRFHAADGGEKKLAEIGESSGIAGRNAISRDSGVEFAEDVIDVGGGHVIAGEGLGEFGAETVGFEELQLGTCVEDAERAVAWETKHAAAATVSERELAEGGFRGCGAVARS